jgi:hypothetical protein
LAAGQIEKERSRVGTNGAEWLKTAVAVSQEHFVERKYTVQYGAGIGSGSGSGTGSSIVVNLSILGGTITANGALDGIGSGGNRGSVKQLTFSGKAVLICSSAGTGTFPVNAASILFSDASAIFVTHHAPLFGVRQHHDGGSQSDSCL